MVTLYLSTTKGNGGIRHFPYQGFLGLTPVRIDGIVRTRLDEDQKPIPAFSLTVYVRSYEARQTRTGSLHSRILAEYSQTVWRKPDGQDYASLGDFEHPFKITLPKRVAGYSTANYQDYRTFWRVEAVLEHAPSPSVGSRIVKYFDLALIRYDIPPSLPPPTPSSYDHPSSDPSTSLTPTLPHVTNKPRAPVLHYNLSTPTYPIGPSDLLFTSLFLRPRDPSVSIRSASLLVERRIDLLDADLPLSPSQAPTSPHPPRIAISSSLPEREANVREGESYAMAHSLAASHSTSTIDSVASTSTVTSRSPLIPYSHSHSQTPHSPLPTHQAPKPLHTSYTDPLSYTSHSSMASPTSPTSPPSDPQKTLTTTVAASSFPSFSLDPSTGVFSKTLSLPWPASRSHSRWSMGETMRGSLGSVTFWVRVKVIVTSPTTGTETIDLAPRELNIVLTNDAERRQALAKFAEAHAKSAEKRRAVTAPEESSEKEHRTVNLATADSPSPFTHSPDTPSSYPNPYYPPANVYIPPKSADTASSSKSSKSAPPPMPLLPVSASRTSTSSGFGKVLPSRKKSRRPHTSAGPQDRERDSVDVSMPMPRMGVSDATNMSPTGRSSPSSYPYPYPKPHSPTNTFSSPSSSLSLSSSSSTASSRLRSPTSIRPHSPTGSSDVVDVGPVSGGINGVGGPGMELVRAWEEELKRIEKASKRGSRDMLGFWGLGKSRERAREKAERERMAHVRDL
ncbi:hypothetical protein PHLCEN_2v725 [Hermanssonia centrifuga]|uniref:Uncharacterized protein n=1 Tax=Hermanssonia centrifuga TaxID=98765 RepID=A0A2R6S554_9APHY|nr:hypothetical protein PHLCEN_2v725 [Hermanssonia centrifuga]